MAGHRGPEGHLRRLRVANFADQDDVGVLPQQASHTAGERQAGGLVDRGLTNPPHRVLDRVLQGHDVDRLGIEMIQHRVQGGGLPAPGRPGHEDQSLGAGHHEAQQGERVLVQPEPVEGHDALVPVEHPQHDVLAEGRR